MENSTQQKLQERLISLFGTNLSSYYAKPIENKELRNTISTFAQSFKTKHADDTYSFNLALDDKNTFDFGGKYVNTSTICSILNLDQNTRLCNLLSQVYQYKCSPDNTVAAFVVERKIAANTSKRLGWPVFRQSTQILIWIASQTRQISVVIDPTGLFVVGESLINPDPEFPTPEAFNSQIENINERFTNNFNEVTLIKDNAFKNASLKTIDTATSQFTGRETYQFFEFSNDDLVEYNFGTKVRSTGSAIVSNVEIAVSESPIQTSSFAVKPGDVITVIGFPSKLIDAYEEVSGNEVDEQLKCTANCLNAFASNMSTANTVMQVGWIGCAALIFPPAVAICWSAARAAFFVLFIRALEKLSDCFRKCQKLEGNVWTK